MILQAFLHPETVCFVCQELNVQPTKVFPTVTCYQWVDWARWNSDCRSIFSRTNSKFWQLVLSLPSAQENHVFCCIDTTLTCNTINRTPLCESMKKCRPPILETERKTPCPRLIGTITDLAERPVLKRKSFLQTLIFLYVKRSMPKRPGCRKKKH